MFRTRLALAGSLLATTMVLPAQYTEVGDAGDLPTSAQVIPFNYPGTLPSIAGNLTSSDVDMYLLEITDPVTFTATTVGGATFDTQLFLFFLDGRGVTSNDDSVGVQSSLSGTFVPHAGTYYLAVSGYNRDPLATGALIWNSTPFGTERRPDGPHRHEPVDVWGGAGGGGAYTIALTGCLQSEKQVVAPDNHHFSESAVQTGPFGSQDWWRGAGGRFQILYEASNFLNSGVNGGAFIDQVMFRGEGGEPNLGGQQWANVSLRLARTPMTAAGLGVDFAANLAAATAVSGVINIATVTVDPSIGSTPNNYNIRLNVPGGYLYNPTLGNLLIDVTMPTPATLPPASGAVMQMEDTTGNAAFIRGAGVNTANPVAATGTLSATPLVVALKIDGPGGDMPLIPARNEYFGAACGGSPSTFYQAFLNGQPFDLLGLTMTPNNVATPTFYQVTSGAGAFDASKVNVTPNSIADDSTVAHVLGFNFLFPGGSATSIRPSTNGYVWLNGTTTTADFTPTLGELLGTTVNNPPRLMPCWYDFNCGRNVTTHPNSGMHVLTDTSGGPGNAVCYVTWLNVGVFNSIALGGHAVHNMQCVMFEATGVVEFRYGAMPVYCSNAEPPNPSNPAFVGFTRGRIVATPSVDPQSRDLSVDVPFVTQPEGANGNVGQVIVASPDVGGIAYGGRAFAGQVLTFNAVNVPPGSLIGAQLLDIAPSQPGVNIPGIHAAGCVQSTSLAPLIHQVHVFPPSTTVGSAPVVIPPGVEGFELYAQFALLDGLFGGPTLVTSLSNAVRIRVGRD